MTRRFVLIFGGGVLVGGIVSAGALVLLFTQTIAGILVELLQAVTP